MAPNAGRAKVPGRGGGRGAGRGRGNGDMILSTPQQPILSTPQQPSIEHGDNEATEIPSTEQVAENNVVGDDGGEGTSSGTMELDPNSLW